jgi:hypothetical protein
MIRKIVKSKLSVSFLVFSALIVLGSIFRYIRLLYPELSFVPYIIEIFLWFYIVFSFFSLNRVRVNRVDLLISIIFVFACISFTVLWIRYGLSTQKVFFATFILPLSIYYYVKSNSFVSVYHLDRLLKIFTIFGLLFFFAEFYSINYMNFHIFNFALYWEGEEVEGFHTSKLTYAFLGELTRPWGFMAMPQSTGSVFAALSIYFFSKYFFLVKRLRSRADLLYIVFALAGVYISGSRTAIVIIAAMLLFIFRKNLILFLTSIGIGLLLVFTFLLTTEVSLKGYYNIVPKFLNGLSIDSMDRLADLLFGQGLNTVIGREIIGIDESHLLNHFFYTGAFLYLMLMILLLFLYKIYSVGLSNKLKTSSPYHMAFLLFIFTLILGSMHYDSLMRYPVNIIALSMIAIISRDVSLSKKGNP